MDINLKTKQQFWKLNILETCTNMAHVHLSDSDVLDYFICEHHSLIDCNIFNLYEKYDSGHKLTRSLRMIRKVLTL